MNGLNNGAREEASLELGQSTLIFGIQFWRGISSWEHLLNPVMWEDLK